MRHTLKNIDLINGIMMNVGFPIISLLQLDRETIKASLCDVYLKEISALEYALLDQVSETAR